jgi:hypothetical protein
VWPCWRGRCIKRANRQEPSAALGRNLPSFSKNALGCHVFGRQPWPNADRRHVHASCKLFPCRRILRHGGPSPRRATITQKPSANVICDWRAGGRGQGRPEADNAGQPRKETRPWQTQASFLRLFPSCSSRAPYPRPPCCSQHGQRVTVLVRSMQVARPQPPGRPQRIAGLPSLPPHLQKRGKLANSFFF